MTSLIISILLKNETLASLVATRDNNIDSISDLINSKIKVIVDGHSGFYHYFIKKNVKNYQNRFKPVKFIDIYSEQTLIKLLQGTHALLYHENNLKHIHMINYKYPLYLSKSGVYLLVRGFIMKKSIGKSIENKINKVYVHQSH